MKLASHNSWSYGRPQRWWMRIFQPFTKCQSKSITEQFNLGVRLFDLRLKTFHGLVSTAHGAVVYGSPIIGLAALDEMSKMSEVHVRVLLEERNPGPLDIKDFRDYCMWMEKKFPNIRFFGGHGAHGAGWYEQYYKFSNLTPLVYEYHASVAEGVHLIPKFFARTHNRTKFTDGVRRGGYLMLDFVEYV